ncbi:hypothetical protein RMSM_06123 [Rhodopirellula maiorica SM1]|uniref:Uncharacterized protein n=1 Tax=Rhodopirellula maiorica SM1 TaxID=1265738 RepID=M5RSK6_9BACT|nr:hypothetical protein [Rhodopirellula maiorica]EMI16949.1 hypothetical protein RMSM_06123 [Rhodopirellula maiorica SM1]
MPSYRWKRIEKLNQVDRVRLGRNLADGNSADSSVRFGNPQAAPRARHSRGEFFANYRVDSAHDVAAESNDASAVSLKHPNTSSSTPPGPPLAEQWLGLQAADLIERLQRWESDLDAREAQLNARAAIQEHRERQFRLERQAATIDLAEQTRAAQRLHADLKTQARRLAFEG